MSAADRQPSSTRIHDAARAFALPGRIVDVQPLGKGLINDTYLVTTDAARHAVLQRINTRVFPEPARIMENLRTLMSHVAYRANKNGGRDLLLPEIFATTSGDDLFIDEAGDCWRAMSYIANTVSYEKLSDAHQAREVGSVLGRFHALLHDLESSRLNVTRPGFHNTPGYYAHFTQALEQAPVAPADVRLDFCLQYAAAHADIVSILEDAKASGALQLRAIHGDPKIDNVLFDATTGDAVSLVDLDTVQPALVHYDLGDCLRSACNPVGENPADETTARFDLEVCRLMLTAYVNETRAFLSAEDYRYLPAAIRLIPFELGLRFLTDHLRGDVYFKVKWRGHNLLRAATQFHLAASVEQQLGAIENLVANLASSSR